MWFKGRNNKMAEDMIYSGYLDTLYGLLFYNEKFKYCNNYKEFLKKNIGHNIIDIDYKTEINTDLYIEVKDILGLYFEELENFFNDVFFSFEKNRAILCLSYRSALLSYFFLNYLVKIKKREINKEDDNIFTIGNSNCKNYLIINGITNFSSIPHNVQEVYLIDGVCIHGDAMEDTAELLNLYFQNIKSQCNIITCAYAVSEETIRQEPDRVYLFTSRAAWTELFARITEVTNLLSQKINLSNTIVLDDVQKEVIENYLEKLIVNCYISAEKEGVDFPEITIPCIDNVNESIKQYMYSYLNHLRDQGIIEIYREAIIIGPRAYVLIKRNTERMRQNSVKELLKKPYYRRLLL